MCIRDRDFPLDTTLRIWSCKRCWQRQKWTTSTWHSGDCKQHGLNCFSCVKKHSELALQTFFLRVFKFSLRSVLALYLSSFSVCLNKHFARAQQTAVHMKLIRIAIFPEKYYKAAGIQCLYSNRCLVQGLRVSMPCAGLTVVGTYTSYRSHSPEKYLQVTQPWRVLLKSFCWKAFFCSLEGNLWERKRNLF